MDIILNQFDADRCAIIEPRYVVQKIDDFPEICVSTFSPNLVESFVEILHAKQIAQIGSANVRIPIYKGSYQNTSVAFFMSFVGAPACVAEFEEVIQMGCKKLVLFGSCGVLNGEIVDGHIIVPNSAVRDEGTSYHYLPPSNEIALNPACVNSLTKTMNSLGYPYIEGKTWTTDAIYRETKSKVQQRLQQGCICVEMECSAMAAVAQFRDIQFAQFLFAADNLDAPQWEPRGLGKHDLSVREKYMALALECAVNLP